VITLASHTKKGNPQAARPHHPHRQRRPGLISCSTRAAADTTQTGWLRTYALPSYAYDLNPADGVWGNLKTVDLANRVNTDLDDIERAVARGMCRIRHRPDLLWNLLTRCGLSLPP
jgi:hypothetical protein